MHLCRTFAVGCLVAMAAGWITASTCRAADASPNIIVVLFDDLGFGQPESYRSDSTLRMPNLNKLAAQGMRFTDAHAPAAVCTPTRYGLLTGRYPSRIGQFGVLTTYSRPIIPADRMTVASLLRRNGYVTACIGKWHLGMEWVDGKPGTEKEVPVGSKMTGGPNTIGFDYFYGFTHARNIFSVIEQDAVARIITSVESQPLMIDKAVGWIDDRAKDGKPFFLYFPMCPPHTPVVPAPDFVGKSNATDPVGKDPKYGDWVYQGDAMLGRIMETLDRHKLSDNTLIIATSDNGAEHRAYEPLRESKRSIYEGGHRVPFVARWPGKIRPGTINDHTICLTDIMATAAEIVGAKIPATAGEDSVSLLPELLGTSADGVREATVHQSAAGDLAIRQGPWKLVFLKSGKRELYNLRSDLSETKDAPSDHAEVAEKLAGVMEGYIARGRSTPGADQKNDYDLAIPDGKAKPKTKKDKAERSEAERQREIELALEAGFD